jgi:hypothetical protein
LSKTKKIEKNKIPKQKMSKNNAAILPRPPGPRLELHNASHFLKGSLKKRLGAPLLNFSLVRIIIYCLLSLLAITLILTHHFYSFSQKIA